MFRDLHPTEDGLGPKAFIVSRERAVGGSLLALLALTGIVAFATAVLSAVVYEGSLQHLAFNDNPYISAFICVVGITPATLILLVFEKVSTRPLFAYGAVGVYSLLPVVFALSVEAEGGEASGWGYAHLQLYFAGLVVMLVAHRFVCSRLATFICIGLGVLTALIGYIQMASPPN